MIFTVFTILVIIMVYWYFFLKKDKPKNTLTPISDLRRRKYADSTWYKPSSDYSYSYGPVTGYVVGSINNHSKPTENNKEQSVFESIIDTVSSTGGSSAGGGSTDSWSSSDSSSSGGD